MSSDRRTFFTSLARAAAGVLLGGGTAWLATKSDAPCWTGGACRTCPKLDACDLPEGKLARAQRLPRRTRKDAS